MKLNVRAVTAVDLLVTVAAAGLLLGVFSPALLRVRQQSQIAASLGNLRQIGAAATAFRTDTGDLPWTGRRDGSGIVHYRTGRHYSFSTWTEFAWGGGRPNASALEWNQIGTPGLDPLGSEAYRVPPDGRLMNRYISPRVEWSDPRRDNSSARIAIPMRLPGVFKSPGDSTARVPAVGQPNEVDPTGSPATTWYFWGTSYSINWWWAYYYEEVHNDSVIEILGGFANTPSRGREMFKNGADSRWAGRFVMFMDARLNYLLANAAPRGLANDEPNNYLGWYGEVNKHCAAFLDGSARYQTFDTRYINGPGWTVWPAQPWEAPWDQYADQNR